MDPLLLAGLLATVGGLSLGIAALVSGAQEKRAVGRSLAYIGVTATAGPTSDAVPFKQRVLAPAVERGTQLGRRMTRAGAVDRLTHQLDLAGNPALWTLERVLAMKAIGTMVAPVVAVLLFGSGGVARTVLLAVAFGAGAYFLPNVLAYNTGVKRQERIQKSLPDALDLLTVSVEAGMGFDAAIAHVAKHTDGPLSAEFFRVLQEMQMKSRSEAFRALADRTTVTDLRTFVSSLVQADKLGIPIGRVLREQSKEMRLKRRQRAEERAMKLPVKILFPMVVCILPVLFIVVLAPAGMEIAKTAGG